MRVSRAFATMLLFAGPARALDFFALSKKLEAAIDVSIAFDRTPYINLTSNPDPMFEALKAQGRLQRLGESYQIALMSAMAKDAELQSSKPLSSDDMVGGECSGSLPEGVVACRVMDKFQRRRVLLQRHRAKQPYRVFVLVVAYLLLLVCCV